MNSHANESMELLCKQIVQEIYLKIMTNAQIQISTFESYRSPGAPYDAWIESQIERWKPIREHMFWLHRNNAFYSLVNDILTRGIRNGEYSIQFHVKSDSTGL